MADYFLYLLDRQGRIIRRIELRDCVDDARARDLAAAYRHQAGMELWQGGRLVETYSHPKTD
jgi:hypothetical protein